MKYVGTTNNASSIVPKSYVDSKCGSTLVATLMFRQDKGQESVYVNIESGELYDTDEVRLFRYTAAHTGEGRKHGWIHPLNSPTFALEEESGKWLIRLTGYRDPLTGLTRYGTFREYESVAYNYNDAGNETGFMLRLNKKCAFAIYRNGERISDFLHFRVQRNKNKKTGVVRYDLALW